MRFDRSFIAVDWGTTNRRAYLLDASGAQTDEFEDGQGILSVASGGFPAAVGEIRERLGDLPLLMAGMVGSNRGWVEAPYAPCPAGSADLVERIVWPEPGRTAIIPGVCLSAEGRADVMRGEEVQLLGAIASDEIPADCLVCHPGTHNKWVEVAGARIAGFTTVMTGEMFSLLKEQSILADVLRQPVAPDDAFREGVAAAAHGRALTADLFSVRARVVLGEMPAARAASFTSGLLIGADVRTGLAGHADQEVIVMGRPELTVLYAAALQFVGQPCREYDGERAFIAGIKAIAGAMK
jgi:2-dehydro-3-deoxygalactonokinase